MATKVVVLVGNSNRLSLLVVICLIYFCQYHSSNASDQVLIKRNPTDQQHQQQHGSYARSTWESGTAAGAGNLAPHEKQQLVEGEGESVNSSSSSLSFPLNDTLIKDHSASRPYKIRSLRTFSPSSSEPAATEDAVKTEQLSPSPLMLEEEGKFQVTSNNNYYMSSIPRTHLNSHLDDDDKIDKVQNTSRPPVAASNVTFPRRSDKKPDHKEMVNHQKQAHGNYKRDVKDDDHYEDEDYYHQYNDLQFDDDENEEAKPGNQGRDEHRRRQDHGNQHHNESAGKDLSTSNVSNGKGNDVNPKGKSTTINKTQSQDRCKQGTLHQCISQIPPFPDIGIPSTNLAVLNACNAYHSGMNCVNNWALNCLSEVKRRQLNSSIIGAHEVFTFLCNDPKFRIAYLQHGQCFNQISKYWDTCAKRFISALKSVKNVETSHELCCVRYAFLHCAVDVTNRYCDKRATEFTQLMAETLIRATVRGLTPKHCEHTTARHCPLKSMATNLSSVNRFNWILSLLVLLSLAFTSAANRPMTTTMK